MPWSLHPRVLRHVFSSPATIRLALDSMPHARFEFTGPVGERIHANLGHGLLRAPQANPGLFGMCPLNGYRGPA